MQVHGLTVASYGGELLRRLLYALNSLASPYADLYWVLLQRMTQRSALQWSTSICGGPHMTGRCVLAAV